MCWFLDDVENMTEPKRTYQESAANKTGRNCGGVVLYSCGVCPSYKFPRCGKTGEDIPYPVTGPTGSACPLPRPDAEAESE